MKTKTILALLGIMILAVFLRFYALDQFPPGLYPDEAVNGTDALGALETGNFKVYYPNNNGREGLFINCLAIAFKFLGVSIPVFRMVPALIGSLTVLAVFFLGKEMFGLSAGLIASFLVATSYWHLNFSRVGFRAIFVPLILSLTFYLLFLGYRKSREIKGNKKFVWQKNWLIFLLAGLVFGVGFHTYIAFRIAPAVIAVFFLFLLLVNFKKPSTWMKLIIFPTLFFALGTFLTALPIFYDFWKYPEHLNARQDDNSISVLDLKNNNGNLPLALSKTFLVTLSQFFFRGDMNWRHNLPPNPLLSPFVSLMLFSGIIFSILVFLKSLLKSLLPKGKQKSVLPDKVKTVKYGTLLAWFVVMLAPAFLTVEGLPHALRSIGSLPAVFIIASLPITLLLKAEWLAGKNKKRSWFSPGIKKGVIFLALLLTLVSTVINYFFVWGISSDASGAFEKRLVNIGYYLKDSNKAIKYVILGRDSKIIDSGYPVSRETIKFTSFGSKNEIVYLFSEETKKINPRESFEIIPVRPDDELLLKLKREFNLKTEQISLSPEYSGTEFVVLRP